MAGDLFYQVTVTSSGTDYDLSEDLSSFTVEQREAEPDLLTVDMNDPFKVLSHALQEGMDIKVALGTADEHSVIFRGRIYKTDGTFPPDGKPTLKLQAYDARMRMGLRKRNRVWADMALSDIVKAIASGYFTDIDIGVMGDPRFPGNGIRQQEETDLAFLVRLAAIYGCVMHVTAGDSADTFHFLAQYTVMKTPSGVTLYYGRADVTTHLLSFQSSVDASQIDLPRVLSGIDYDTGQATEVTTTEVLDAGTIDDPFFDENLTAYRASQPLKAAQLEQLLGTAAASQSVLLADLGTSVREAAPAFITEQQQAERAQNQFSTSLRGMRATGSALGIKELVAQTSVTIADVGGRFSGTWFLSQVRHILDQQGYRTEFECRR